MVARRSGHDTGLLAAFVSARRRGLLTALRAAFIPTRRRAFYVALLAACVATRLVTTIYYVEDTDSLRFALSVADAFDVAALQPHFPGYPVFWAAAKVLYALSGSFAIAFSLIGGLATFAVVYIALRLARRDPLSIDGLAIAFVLFFNPMIWLMGNRYMPDLLGLAAALAALWALTGRSGVSPGAGGALTDRSGVSSSAGGAPTARSGVSPSVAGALTGLLAGTRLSYMPLLLPAYVLALRRTPLRLLAWTAAGVAIWLLPLIVDTGWSDLIAAAAKQTEGHFTEFGGTVETNPDLLTRLGRMVEGIWADGFGGWWAGRHGLTLVVGAGIVGALSGWLSAVRSTEWRWPSGQVAGLAAAAITYAAWIFLFQNVIYKSRHVLPLVALLCIPVGLGLAQLVRRRAVWSRAAAAVFAAAYVAVTLVLVVQHREPAAVAQVKRYVEAVEPDMIASIPLVNYYLSAQGVDARFVSVQDPSQSERLADAAGTLMVIGRYPDVMPPNPSRADTFYHNPYVNRMWPEIEVYVYER